MPLVWTSGALPSWMTFARADASTCATYFDKNGIMRLAAASVARIEAKGALNEPASTNKSRNNNVNPTDGTNLTGGALTYATYPADTAALTAAGLNNVVSSVVRINNTSGGNVFLNFTGPAGNTNNHVFSAYVRGSGTFAISPAAGTGPGARTATSSYVRYDSGGAGEVSGQPYIRINAGADLYICLNQLEELPAGSVPTSAIANTTGAAITRAEDILTIGGSNFSRFFNPSKGTILLEAMAAYLPGGGAFRPLAFDDGTANNHLIIDGYGGTTTGFVQSGGVTVAQPNGSSIAANQVMKAALAFSVNDYAFCVNGGTVGTDTAGALPTGLTTARFFRDWAGSRQGRGWIRRLKFFPRRLTNAELQALTAS